MNAIGQFRDNDLLDRFDQKQRSLERQLTGLVSFAQHVEKFLAQSTSGGATAPVERLRLMRRERERPTATLEQTPGASSSSTRPPPYVQIPEPPSVPAPPVPPILLRQILSNPAQRISVQSEVKSEQEQSALILPILRQWSAGDTAILRNQEAKRVRDIRSLIFETPIQHDYEAGVEVRSLLPTERLEEIDGRLAVTDEDPRTHGVRYAKF